MVPVRRQDSRYIQLCQSFTGSKIELFGSTCKWRAFRRLKTFYLLIISKCHATILY
jgi:hypothetical protein